MIKTNYTAPRCSFSCVSVDSILCESPVISTDSVVDSYTYYDEQYIELD